MMIHAHTQAHGIYLPRIWNKKHVKESYQPTSAHCLYKGAGPSGFHGHGDEITKTHGVITCVWRGFQKLNSWLPDLGIGGTNIWIDVKVHILGLNCFKVDSGLSYSLLFSGVYSLIMIHDIVTTSESPVFTNMATQQPNRTLTTLKIIAGGPKATSLKDLQSDKFDWGDHRGGILLSCFLHCIFQQTIILALKLPLEPQEFRNWKKMNSK